MKLVPNWRAAHRMMSMWAYAATLGVVGSWPLLTWITGEHYSVTAADWWGVLALQLVGFAGRMIAQPGLVEDVAAELRDAAS